MLPGASRSGYSTVSQASKEILGYRNHIRTCTPAEHALCDPELMRTCVNTLFKQDSEKANMRLSHLQRFLFVRYITRASVVLNM